MPRTRQVPTTTDIITNLERRISQLERALSAVVDARRTPELFSFSGALAASESPPWRPVHPTEIDLIVPQVLTAPSGGDLVIWLILNGVTIIRVLTVPDGENYIEDAVPFVIPAGQILTAAVITPSGAADLSISLIPKLL